MNKGVYYISSAMSTTYRLTLCANGTASKSLNVVLNSAQNKSEQKWYFDGNKLLSCCNRKFCLDRYTLSDYLNNADIWTNTSSDNAAQKIIIESDSNGVFYTIKLASKINNQYYYLTAVNVANGTNSGKSTTSSGNVYWAPATSSNNQLWKFSTISLSTSAATMNGIKVPLPEYPVGSYWTLDGTATGNSKDFLGEECAGFANYLYYCIWSNENYGSELGAKRTCNGTSTDFSGIPVGSKLHCKPTSSLPNHSMILLAKDSSGVTIYDCNRVGYPNEHCRVGVATFTYAEFKNKWEYIKANSRIPN